MISDNREKLMEDFGVARHLSLIAAPTRKRAGYIRDKLAR
jgi:hypothetical protein